MSILSEPGGIRGGLHEQPDLRQQYRSIGIGAVAAALSVTANDTDGKKAVHRSPSTRDERPRYHESEAA